MLSEQTVKRICELCHKEYDESIISREDFYKQLKADNDYLPTIYNTFFAGVEYAAQRSMIVEAEKEQYKLGLRAATDFNMIQKEEIQQLTTERDAYKEALGTADIMIVMQKRERDAYKEALEKISNHAKKLEDEICKDEVWRDLKTIEKRISEIIFQSEVLNQFNNTENKKQ